MTTLIDLKPNITITAPFFSEPIQVIAVVSLGDASVKLFGKGLKTNQVYEPVLSTAQLERLVVAPETAPFDGDAVRFQLGIEAMRLALAHEYDPYFALSIARIDPLPHQLEAVYDYFLRLPRIRFLLADDPGAGKTIMAGLLLKELKTRGLVKRTLIVTPANLSFQWQREMKDRFRESFEVIRGDVLRASYGTNPWQERNQVITSVSWVSRVEDAHDSLMRSHWDLIIVDEAHKMSAYSSDRKTLTYKLGEALSELTDHYLLMTATPHKGDPVNFCLFLELLDRDVYGDVKSLEEAMRRNSAPFYLRRTKEALVSFPDPETGVVKKLFTKREVRTADFEITEDEYDFYDELTRYVEDQSIRAAQEDSARGRALGFTMAMLQRRFASSIYAVRRSLERMRDRREKIIEDPRDYLMRQLDVPDDLDELPEDEAGEYLDQLEEAVLSFDPTELRKEIAQLNRLIDQAKALEQQEIESKLLRLRSVLEERGIFDNPKMKLLIFTEHKDTLDYLAADGRDGRPLGKLREWSLKVTQIHGGMKIGDRDTPGTRIYAEREFREDVQIMVATEAAGEGINLQFCWFMINYDIPWNPVRLEQRMGRIHRYGQEHDCLIFNFVSTSTREGRVLQRLLDRLREIRKDLGTEQVFDVVGEIFPSNLLEKLFREMYARRISEPDIKARIVKEVDAERFRKITASALEGLAKREVNLAALVGKRAEAKERRLVPEVVEDFFLDAGEVLGVQARELRSGTHVYRVSRIPRTLLPVAERLEPRFGRLGREYKQIVFDKALTTDDPTLEWVTPGHPLFEVVREGIYELADDDLRRGAIFYDLESAKPYHLDVFDASIKDGLGNTVKRQLFAVKTETDGKQSVRQPTIFLALLPAPEGTTPPDVTDLPGRQSAEQVLIEQRLKKDLEEVAAEREREVRTISDHIEIALGEIINRQQLQMADLLNRQVEGDNSPQLKGLISQAEMRLDELNTRLEKRRADLEMERYCTIGSVVHVGAVWVLPHPERDSPEIAPMVSDDVIEHIAVEEATRYEEARGWVVESVEDENRGFDLISRKPSPENPDLFTDVRFIEVKGREGVGGVILSENEYKKANTLKEDYWLYVVLNCTSNPELHAIQNPTRLDFKTVIRIQHHLVDPQIIIDAAQGA